MANYLADLSYGLRQAAGVLNPDIQKQTFAADEREKSLQEQFLMSQMAPQAQLAREQIREVQEASKRRSLINAELSQLPPEQRTNPLALASVFIKHGEHESAAKHIDRFEATQTQRQSSINTLTARLYDIQSRVSDKSLDRAERSKWEERELAIKQQLANQQKDYQQGLLDLKKLQAAGNRQHQISNEGKLRDDFNQLSKNFIAQRDAHQRVLASAQEPTAAGDLSLIFNYMKVLDPISVVRESEFIQAAQTGSYGERMKATVNKVLKGERLSAEIRKDFVDRSSKLYAAGEKNQETLEKRFTDMARGDDLRPDNIVVPYRITQSTSGPKVGDVVDGYKFKGGDPSKQENWEKQ